MVHDQPDPSFDYIAETDKTASGMWQPEVVGRLELLNAVSRFVDAGQELDKYKKLLFRGQSRDQVGLASLSLNSDKALNYLQPQEADYFHCAIGVATEAGELCEPLLSRLENDAYIIDKTNIFEEIGDLLWYLSRGLKWVGLSFLLAMKANIAKLRMRHGNAGFNTQGDQNRDLFAERQVLSGED